jgi:SNF2 family DNA or RNA helicase
MENVAEDLILHANRIELDEHSTCATQPDKVEVQLKQHQLTLLQHCINIENQAISITGRNNKKGQIRTRIGIIGDKVGSGKSYVMLGLIASESLNTFTSHPMSSSFAFDNIQIEYEDVSRYNNTSVIVIPHNLIKQWTGYISSIIPSIKCCFITTTKQVVALHDKQIEDYGIILVSSTFYNSFVQICKEKNSFFKRVFYDEVDSIPIRSCERIGARFTWFVTASFKNLMYPRGHGMWDQTQHRFVHVAEGIKSTGYIRTMFTHVIPTLTSLIVAKNSDRFVDAAMQLPPIQNYVTMCRTPRTITILDGIVDRNIMSALNANDIEGAIQYINPANRSSEDHIISILLDKYNRTLQNAKVMLRLVNDELEYDTEALRTSEIIKVQKSIDEYQHKISNIIERIKGTDSCCICYDNITNKSVVDCCQNAFCFKCLTTWLDTRQSCPSCRNKIGTQNVYVVSKQLETTQQDELVESNSTQPSVIGSHNDKYENLEVLLRTRPTSKFLIFSCYDSTFEKTETLLQSLNIRYSMLKGSHDVIAAVVDRYKNGSLNVLLVNPKNYGSGLNLENTTDIVVLHKFDSEIEQQVIGRAQRMGRTCSLNAWYFLYQNEMPAATAI